MTIRARWLEMFQSLPPGSGTVKDYPTPVGPSAARMRGAAARIAGCRTQHWTSSQPIGWGAFSGGSPTVDPPPPLDSGPIHTAPPT